MDTHREAFQITGLAGKRTLHGEIPVRGAKNDALKAIPASFLFGDTLTIENIPHIADISAMANLVKGLGGTVETEDRTMHITTATADGKELPVDIAKRMRASVVSVGPVLARFGHVSFPHPGGCVIGARPIDLFLKSFEQMGATYETDDKFYHIRAKDGKLHGADIFLDIASVGVTETVMMAAVLAEGTTVIRNAAMEPEIQNLASFFVSCGAHITGIGTPTLTIVGGDLLKTNGKPYTVIPDRIEAGSFAILAALAGTEIKITGCNLDHLRALLSAFDKAGVRYEKHENALTVYGTDTLKAVNIKTHEYPGFATDLQAPMAILLTQAEGESLIFETMFEGRLHFTDDLVKMGADITMFDPHRVMIRGKKQLVGRELESPDLRAGLAFVIAGLIATKTSRIRNIHHIDRGYEKVEERFRALGAQIERVPD